MNRTDARGGGCLGVIGGEKWRANIRCEFVFSFQPLNRCPPPQLQQAPKAFTTTAALKDTSSKMAAVTVAAAIAFAAPMVVAPEEAFARDVQPYAGLTPCKKNAGFKKREKQEIKALTKRLNKVSDNGGAAPRDGEKILF
jgi:hypothetical protein